MLFMGVPARQRWILIDLPISLTVTSISIRSSPKGLGNRAQRAVVPWVAKAIRCVGEIPKRSLDIILPNETVLMDGFFVLS